MQQVAPSSSLRGCPEYGLLSLWDMYKYHAEHLVVLARNLATLQQFVDAPPNEWANKLLALTADKTKHETVKSFMVGLKKACDDADLTISAELVETYAKTPPKNSEGMHVLLNAIIAELKLRLYLRIPDDRAKYWEKADLLTEPARQKFPMAYAELTASSTAFACGLWVASVFHSMRAAEVGLRAMAIDLGVTFTHGDLSLEQWMTIIRSVEAKIKEIEQEKKSTDKADRQRFYSEAAAQFRFFKDGYRVRAAHVFDPFSQSQALSILNQTCAFFEVLAEKMTEPGRPS